MPSYTNPWSTAHNSALILYTAPQRYEVVLVRLSHMVVLMYMYIACLCPNLVSVHFYAIPISHIKQIS